MLERLSIQGFALIDTMSVQFCDSFNVITGETGAGKSILIRALQTLTGHRVSPDWIRSGAKQATVSAVFRLAPSHPTHYALANLGLSPADEDSKCIIIRRTFTNKGKSTQWINDSVVTLTTLREVGSELIDIFGQHDNQKLLSPHVHMKFVDALVSPPQIVRDYQASYRRSQELWQELDLYLKRYQSLREKSDYLKFRLSEFEKLNPSIDDYQQLHEKAKSLENIEKTNELRRQVVASIEGDHESLSGSLKKLIKLLGKFGELFSEQAQSLVISAEILDDIHFQVGEQIEKSSEEQSQLESIHERQYAYQQLMRKLCVQTTEDLIQKFEFLKNEIEANEGVRNKIVTTIEELKIVAMELKTCAEKLSKKRKTTFESLRKNIEFELHELAMNESRLGGSWEILKKEMQLGGLDGLEEPLLSQCQKLTTQLSEFSESGTERVQFLLQSNKGEALMPLHRIASGGELSRIMLAIKKSITEMNNTCVLVFDEIDAGISGRVADVVGKKISELSKKCQIICISHLPQVAVHATRHYVVKKEETPDDRTFTSLTELTDEQSSLEIARLLSGSVLEASSVSHAKHLKRKARDSVSRL